MTLRAKPVVKRAHRSTWRDEDRRNLYTNVGFGLAVVAAIVIVVIAAVGSWYRDHLEPVGSVNGQSITKDDLRAQAQIEDFKLELEAARLREELAAGRITRADNEAMTEQINQQRAQVTSLALTRIIDARIQEIVAQQESITVTDEQIQAQITEEATVNEQRLAWTIEVRPSPATGETEATEAQIAAARTTAEKALAELKAGKDWDTVAQTYSTAVNAPQGGRLGYITEDDTLDPPTLAAIRELADDTFTEVVAGEDDIFRIGRVTEIVPERLTPSFEDRVANAGISAAAFRAHVRAGALRAEMERLVTERTLVAGDTPQRRVAEIFIAAPNLEEVPAEAVRTRHILYSPNDDPQSASNVADTDPAWTKAEQDARAAFDKVTAKPTDFDKIAREESDETQAVQTGGKLPYFDREQFVAEFADAVMAPGLQPGQILEPVKTAFGWHVIQILWRPPDLERANQIKAEAEAGADFAQLARDNSDGEDSADGGDRGWVARGMLFSPLEEVVFGAPVGSITAPVELDDLGIFIYRIHEESNRPLTDEQRALLEDEAFTNWYTPRRLAIEVTRVDEDASSLAGG